MNDIDGELGSSKTQKKKLNPNRLSSSVMYKGQGRTEIPKQASTQSIPKKMHYEAKHGVSRPEETKNHGGNNRNLSVGKDPTSNIPLKNSSAVMLNRVTLSERHAIPEKKLKPSENKSLASSQAEVNEKLVFLIAESLSFKTLKDSTKLNEALETVNNEKVNREMKCFKCGDFKVSLKLPCSHLTCANCYKKNLSFFLESKSFESLQMCACPVCEDTGDLSFYSFVLPEQSEHISALDIKRNCTWCKRSLNLCTDFPSEVSCKHLCSICYMNDVYLKSANCICCRNPFANTQLTKRKNASCLKCGKTGSFIKHCFRTIHKTCTFCLSCWVDLINTHSNCWFCSQALTKPEYTILYNFANIKCPLCSNKKYISEINICKNCRLLVCDDCRTPDYKCRC